MGTKQRLSRVVLDSNVYVSALLFKGLTSQFVPLWKSQTIHVLASAFIVQELTRVLSYPKFKLDAVEIKTLLNEDILPFITPVRIKNVPSVIAEDPSDNHILACAQQGKAHAIVSGDTHLLSLRTFMKIPIYTVREGLEKLGVSVAN